MNKILIVDSSPASGMFISKYLVKAGYDVMLTDSPAGINAKVAALRPNLIIISSVLEKESGFDTCKRLKESEKTDYIPVLLITAPDNTGEELRAVEAGADDHFSVSLGVSALTSKIQSLIRIKRLSDQLKRQYIELEEKNKLLDSQLKMAMHVQRSIIQEYDFTQGGAHFYSRYIPALDIGGDYYDILRSDEGKVSILVGDVSGHGISAALLVAMLHTMSRSLIKHSDSPSTFLGYMNREFMNVFQNRENQMYVCMFCAIIDTKNHLVRYSNAGHSLPMHVHKKTRSVTELVSVGTPIGMMEDSYYENLVGRYDSGDTLVFYTDGLSGNYFKGDEDKFLSCLKSVLLDMREEQADAVADAILELTGPDYLDESQKYQMDDMSLIVCRV